MDWDTNSLPLPKDLDPNECKHCVQEPNGTDIAELNQNSYNGSSTNFDRLSFQIQVEKIQTPFTVTKLNTIQNGAFSYQPSKYN